MCFHRYKYMGYTTAYYWWGGVTGGIPVETTVEYKQCEKCGKKKVIE